MCRMTISLQTLYVFPSTLLHSNSIFLGQGGLVTTSHQTVLLKHSLFIYSFFIDCEDGYFWFDPLIVVFSLTISV